MLADVAVGHYPTFALQKVVSAVQNGMFALGQIPAHALQQAAPIFHGTHVPAEEPFTKSEAQLAS